MDSEKDKEIKQLLSTSFGKLIHPKTIGKLKEMPWYGTWNHALGYDPNPFIALIGRMGWYYSFNIQTLENVYELFQDHGMPLIHHAIKLTEKTQCNGKELLMIEYVKNFHEEHKILPSFKYLQEIVVKNNIKSSQLFDTFKHYHLTLNMIHKPALDEINSCFNYDITSVVLHGNPYLNKKFKQWALKMKGSEELFHLEKNIQYIIQLFELIMDKKLNSNDYHFLQTTLFKNREDIVHLMQPLPDFYIMLDADPLFRHQIETMRDLFFDKQQLTPKTYKYVINKASFEYYRSFFIEEGLEKDYVQTPPDVEECELFI